MIANQHISSHADFFIVGEGERIEIQMLGKEGPVNMPFDEVMRVFSKTQDLAWLLGLAGFVAMRCIDRMQR